FRGPLLLLSARLRDVADRQGRDGWAEGAERGEYPDCGIGTFGLGTGRDPEAVHDDEADAKPTDLGSEGVGFHVERAGEAAIIQPAVRRPAVGLAEPIVSPFPFEEVGFAIEHHRGALAGRREARKLALDGDQPTAHRCDEAL